MAIRKAYLVVAAFAAIYIVWGSTYLAVAIALHALPPFFMMGTRSVAGGAILLAYAIATQKPAGSFKTWQPRSWALAIVCGVFFFVGCHGVLAYVQQHIASGLAALLLATIPFWIAGLSAALPGSDRPSIRILTLLIPGLAGVALIAGHGADTSASSGPHASDVLLLLGASASWAVGTILSKRRPGAISSAAFAGTELVAGGLVLIAISAARGEPQSIEFAMVFVPALAAWAYLTLAGTVIAFAAYGWLLTQVPATIVATYTFVNPLIAMVLGWFFLGERPTTWMIMGAALIMISVAGLLIAQHKSNAVRPGTDPSLPQDQARR